MASQYFYPYSGYYSTCAYSVYDSDSEIFRYLYTPPYVPQRGSGSTAHAARYANDNLLISSYTNGSLGEGSGYQSLCAAYVGSDTTLGINPKSGYLYFAGGFHGFGDFNITIMLYKMRQDNSMYSGWMPDTNSGVAVGYVHNSFINIGFDNCYIDGIPAYRIPISQASFYNSSNVINYLNNEEYTLYYQFINSYSAQTGVSNGGPSIEAMYLELFGDAFSASGEFDMYLHSPAPSSGTDLYIYGQDEATNNSTLFTMNFEPVNENISLYTTGGFGKPTPLFLQSIIPNNSSLSAPLVIKTDGSNGSGYANSGNNGYLYIESYVEESGFVDMFVSGGGIDDRNNSVDLFISNFETISDSVPMHMICGMFQDTVDMFIHAKNITENSGYMPIYMNSTSESSVFNSVDMFVNADDFRQNIPLFLNSQSAGQINYSSPLYLNGGGTSNGSMNMFLESVHTTDSGVRIYIAGDGLIPGANVARNAVDMYIARDYDSDGQSVTLSINGPSGIESSVGLSTFGGQYSAGFVDLSIGSSIGNFVGSTSVFIHGF